jgi:hypothetical protein
MRRAARLRAQLLGLCGKPRRAGYVRARLLTLCRKLRPRGVALAQAASRKPQAWRRR